MKCILGWFWTLLKSMHSGHLLLAFLHYPVCPFKKMFCWEIHSWEQIILMRKAFQAFSSKISKKLLVVWANFFLLLLAKMIGTFMSLYHYYRPQEFAGSTHICLRESPRCCVRSCGRVLRARASRCPLHPPPPPPRHLLRHIGLSWCGLLHSLDKSWTECISALNMFSSF